MIAANPFFDTNVLVYAYDSDTPDKRKTAQQLIGRHGATGTLNLSTQVLQEFYVTVTRKLKRPLTPGAARDIVADLAGFPTATIDVDLVMVAMDRSASDQLSYWDALIIESAIKAGCDVLYSEDLQAGRQIEGLTIVNPFVDMPG